MPPDHRGKRTAAFGDDQVRGHHAAFQTVIGDVVNIRASAMRYTDSFKIERRLLVIIKVAEEFGAPNLRAGARAGLARAHALRGEWPEAVRLFEEAIALANERRTWLEVEGHELASLAHAYVEIRAPERAKATAERAIVLVQERGSKIQELENVVALAKAGYCLAGALAGG